MADLVPIPLALIERLAQAVDIDAVFRRAQLPRARFRVGRPQGTTAEFFALWRAVEGMGSEADLGLRLGVETLTEYQDVSTLAVLHSPTLGEGLEKLVRYKRLCCPEQIWLDRADGEARLRFEWVLADEVPPPLVTDLLFAYILAVAQRGTTKPVKPRRIELTRRRIHEGVLRRHFRCEIQFGAPHDVLVFDEVSLALPMISRNAQLLAVLLPGLELAVAQDARGQTLVEDVRLVLSESMCGTRPAMTNVAKSVGMSPRTMQRRLGALGTTYQDVLDEVRRHSARRLLANTDLEMGEISFLLGFEEVNSFMRAFRTWEGLRPPQWRAKHAVRQDVNGTSAGRRRRARSRS